MSQPTHQMIIEALTLLKDKIDQRQGVTDEHFQDNKKDHEDIKIILKEQHARLRVIEEQHIFERGIKWTVFKIGAVLSAIFAIIIGLMRHFT